MVKFPSSSSIFKKAAKAYSCVKKTVTKTIIEHIPSISKITTYFPSLKNDILTPEEDDTQLYLPNKSNNPKPKIGKTYIIASASQPFQLKCGFTEHYDINTRIKGLSGTNISTKFEPIAVIETEYCKWVEQKMHAKFAKYRINPKREFFGFIIGPQTTGNEFEDIQQKYEKLKEKMVKKLNKYAKKCKGKIVV